MKKLVVFLLFVAVLVPAAVAQTVVPSKKLDMEYYQTKREIIRQVQTQWKENDVLHRLQALRTVCRESKQNQPELILRASEFLYQGLLERFGQVGYGGFSAQRNQQEVCEICTEIDKPILAGWGGYVVLSQYIAAYLEQAAAWASPEQLEALDTFAAWLHKYGQYSVHQASHQSWDAVVEIQAFRRFLSTLTQENPRIILERAGKLNNIFLNTKWKTDRVQLARYLNEPVRTGWGETVTFSTYIERVAHEAVGLEGRDEARAAAEFVGHVLD